MIVKFNLSASKVIGVLLVIGIIVTGYYYLQISGYTLQKVNAPSGGNTATSTNTAGTGTTAFENYAQQLGLNTQQFNQCLTSGKYSNLVSSDENDGVAAGVQGTPTFFINGIVVSGAQPYSVFQSVIANATGRSNSVGIGSNPPRGATSGSIVIVEFSDYQCPFCSRAETTIEQVIKDYPQVTLYYRNFPLTQLHQYAEKAAEAAQCAGEQGKFWEYHDVLFANQQEWAAG